MDHQQPIWTTVQSDRNRYTSSLEVEGGTLYCVIEKGDMGGILHQHVIFAPKAPGQDLLLIELDHLRDELVLLRSRTEEKEAGSFLHYDFREFRAAFRDLLDNLEAEKAAAREAGPAKDMPRAILSRLTNREAQSRRLQGLIRAHPEWEASPDASLRDILTGKPLAELALDLHSDRFDLGEVSETAQRFAREP